MTIDCRTYALKFKRPQTVWWNTRRGLTVHLIQQGRAAVKATRKSTKERLLERTTIVRGCWEWQGALSSKGYGVLAMSDGTNIAHRVSYQVFVGPIPEGLQIDHLCRNHKCINPDHLEAVTARVNTLRGFGPTAINHLAKHCPQGHPYDTKNTYAAPSGSRYCRTCQNAADQECGICPKAFTRSNVIKHRRRVHGLEPRSKVKAIREGGDSE